MARTMPNILVTGTPGTGKSTMVEALIARLPALHAVDVGALVRDKQLHSGWDEEYQTYVLDEDKV
jgi:adenylate kinase